MRGTKGAPSTSDDEDAASIDRRGGGGGVEDGVRGLREERTVSSLKEEDAIAERVKYLKIIFLPIMRGKGGAGGVVGVGVGVREDRLDAVRK